MRNKIECFAYLHEDPESMTIANLKINKKVEIFLVEKREFQIRNLRNLVFEWKRGIIIAGD